MTDTRIFAPLEGVRVLELGNYIAAPTAGRLLADFGAEVIKVERPGTGDELRNWRLHKGNTSMLYRTINRNKKSVVLDLRTEAGRQAVLELVAKSRHPAGELPSRHAGEMGPGPGGAQRGEPGAGHHPDLRRSARPARCPSDPGSPPWPRPTAACATWSGTRTARPVRVGRLDRRFDRGPVRGLRFDDGHFSSAKPGGGRGFDGCRCRSGSSTWR